MLRQIVGYHQDERGDWVADLECGHAHDAMDGGGTTPGTEEVGRRREQPPRATAASDVPVSRGTRASCTSSGTVAEHVRHRPPWINRPWVITADGRARHLGKRLRCKKCHETRTG